MTVSSTTSKVSYSGNGSTVAFTVTFYFLADAHVKVLVRSANGTETVKTLGSDYTVSGAGNPAGGTVTFLTAPIAGETVVLARNVPLTQVTDYTPNDPFPAETHEEALDKLTQIVQQINETVDRSLKLSLSNTMTSTEFTVNAATRANKVLGFDAAGELAVTQEIGTYRGNWSSGTAYQQRDIIKDTSNANIYICVTSHTSSGSQPISSNADSAKWALLVDAASAAAAQAAAEAAQAAAETAQAAAELAETNAETAETNAETAETNAETAASTATTQAGIATTQAGIATTQAGLADTARIAAQTAKTAAELAETNAETAEANAETAQAAAELAETNAETAASTATTQAGIATTQAGIATTQAGLAATARTGAETAETNAETAQAAAEAAQAAAEAALADFNETYLGAQASDPTLDNNGDPVTAGDWYFNTTSDRARVYDGAAWDFVAVDTSTVIAKTAATGSAVLPTGTTAQRDATPQAGYIRFNDDTDSFEGYDGTGWNPVGGGNTTGSGLWEHANTISANYTIASGNNALSAGPITVESGVSVVVPSGSNWTIV